jgi:hypothetical protein
MLIRWTEGTDGVLQMKTKYIEPQGWGVISGQKISFLSHGIFLTAF